MKKAISILIILGTLFSGCATVPPTQQVKFWIHEFKAEEFTSATTANGTPYLIYKYVDERFNTADWFDCWIEDWVNKSGGWSHSDPVIDLKEGLIYYQPMYYDGYMTMNAYPASLELNIGVKMRFYHLRAE